jgi:hypothetical protein
MGCNKLTGLGNDNGITRKVIGSPKIAASKRPVVAIYPPLVNTFQDERFLRAEA